VGPGPPCPGPFANAGAAVKPSSRTTIAIIFFCTMKLLFIEKSPCYSASRCSGILRFREIVTRSESETFMSFLSAHQDFMQRTLSSLGNVWKQLLFTASLRTNAGQYHHWGLERDHGVEESSAAIKEAHRDLILKLLEMPVEEAVVEVEEVEDSKQLELKKICPPMLEPCLRRHTDYVLEAARLISHHRIQPGERAA